MKKILAIMVIVMVLVVYFVFIKYQKVGSIEVEGYALSSGNIVKDLLQEDTEEKTLALIKVNEFDSIYRQGKNYYIGEEKKKPVNLTYPVYAKDNSRIWNYSKENQLITDQYESEKGYTNLFIAATNVYNGVDLEKAGPESYWFISFSDSLFMNTIPMIIESKTETITIPIYSILSFQEEKIRYYQKEGESLKLKSMTGIDNDSKVKIEQETETYENLLIKLKLRERVEKKDPVETKDPTKTPEPTPTETPEITDPTPSSTLATPAPTKKPQEEELVSVDLTALTINTYSLTGVLKIVDPDSRIVKMPTFEIKTNNQTFLRKTFSSSGKVEIKGLKPNTTFELIGTYIYKNERGRQIKKTFIEQTFTTKDIDDLEPIKVSFKNDKVFAKKVVLDDFFLENEESSEVLKGIKKVIVTLGDYKFTIPTLQATQLKTKNKISYQTPESLDSNRSYQGKIEFYDVSDNLLKVENGTFKTRTSKDIPTIEVQVKETEITSFQLALKVNNKDDVYLNRFRYEIYDKDQKLCQEGTIEDDNLIKGKNLIGGQVYHVLIYADYDLEDGNGNQINQLLRETKVSTVPLSTLGFIRMSFKEVSIKQASAEYQVTINPKTTDSRLLELLAQVEILIREKDQEKVTKKITITKESIDTLKIGNPVQVLIDSLQSKTEYEVEVITIVKQGDIQSSLPTLTNLKTFKTPKKNARVEIINSFTTENLIDFDVRIIDIDDAIQSSRVLLEVRNSEGRLELMKDLKIGTEYERIQLEKLTKEESYTFKFIAEEYNTGYTNATFEESKVLKEVTMETSVGIYGSIDVESLLSQITSTNLVELTNIDRWKQEGPSTEKKISSDAEHKILKFSSKNGYSNYSYYIPEYKDEVVRVSFSIRHTKESNKQAVYLSIGGGSNHQYLLDNLSTEWKEFSYLVTPEKGNVGLYIDEIVNNNTVTEVEVKNLMIIPLSERLSKPSRKDSFFSDDYVFEKTVLKSGSEEVPTYDGKDTMIGNYGHGYAKITNLQNNTVTTFSYTGSTQSYVVPTTGKYKIEVWGAAGGDGSSRPGYYIDGSSHGGRGGYSAGEIKLEGGITLYIQVGGSGTYGTPATGGYNGGGNGQSGIYNGAGGGATDVRLIGGSWDNKDSLYSRIIIAGGGGGADSWDNCLKNCSKNDDGSGGSGGGIVSEGAYISGVLHPEYGVGQFYNESNLGKGDSPTSGGDSGGAGGGYYGGKMTNHGNGGGAGGSSYISGHTGCISIQTIRNLEGGVGNYIEYEEKEKYLGSIYISLYDTKKEIVTNDFYVQILKKGEEESIQRFDLNESHQLENYLMTYEFSKNSNYQLNLLVKIRERYYSIQSINFKTDEEIRTIRTKEDLFNIHSSGTYLVVNDLDLRGEWRTIEISLGGTIDFQGHKLYMQNSNTLFRYIKPSGKILNLDFHLWLQEGTTWHPGLVSSNAGTLSNLMVTIEQTPPTMSYLVSFITQTNYGTIENFVVNLKQDLIVNTRSALMVQYNRGTIQNGYLYGASIDATSDSGSTGNREVGAIAAQQGSGGKIENVFSLIDMKVMDPQNVSGTFNQNVGNLVGIATDGVINNAYSYTELRNRDLTLDPNLATARSIQTNNLFYVNPLIYANVKSKKLSKVALRNIQFQDQLLNGMNQFLIEDYVKYGFFPQLKMNNMMPRQEYVELPIIADEDLIDIISVDKVESKGKEATITLKVHNPGNEEITDLSIKNLSTQIVSQTTEAGTTILVVRVFDPEKYVSSYFIKSISSIGEFNIPYTREYYANEKILDVDLYREIRTTKEWLEISQLPEENYILMEDLDFRNVPNPSIETFKGVMNGNGHTIKNIESSTGKGIIIQVLQAGTVKNLYIENVKKTNQSGSNALIGSVESSSVVDNVHVTNITLPVTQYTGGLTARLQSGSVISNSSVTEIKIITIGSEQDVRIGGIAGHLSSSTISNCYIQGLDINTSTFGGSVYGIGGIVGQTSGGVIESSYVIGKIEANSPTVGGIVGSHVGTIQKVYSNVDIKSTQGNLAGIVADDTSRRVSNTLSIGSVYSTVDEETTRRTSGNSILNQQNYAWANQRINGFQSTETRGEILLTTDELKQPFIYESIIELGDQFSYEEVENLILPKLYNKDTKELLPNQKDHTLPDHRFEVVAVETSKSITDAIVLVQLQNPENIPITGVEIADMEVMKVRRNITENGLTTLEVQVRPIHYYDSYRLNKVIYEEEGKEKNYDHNIKINLQFYKDLESVEDWQKIDPNLSENYRLVADIDFAGRTDINWNLSFNRLEGTDEGHTLKNIQITSKNAGMYLIREVNKNITKVNFDNIELKYTVSGIGGGIFGNTYGNFSDMQFTNIKLLSDWIQKMGIISDNHAQTIRNIQIENAEIKGNRLVGGLCGYSSSYDLTNVSLSHVTVEGKADGVGGMIGDRPQSDKIKHAKIAADDVHVKSTGVKTGIIYGSGSASEVIITNSSVQGTSYVGGVSGFQDGAASDIKADHIEVTGSGDYIGGLYGYHHTIQKSSITNSTINATGTGKYVGGLVAWGGYQIYDCLVQNVEINGTSDYVGGLEGYAHDGPRQRNAVVNTTVNGRNYVGGLFGGKIENQIIYSSYNFVNAVVNASGVGAGGVIGYYPNRLTSTGLGYFRCWNTIVANSTITASYYAGGLIGQVDTMIEKSNAPEIIILAVNVNTTNENIAPGIVIGNSDASVEKMPVIKIYNQSQINGKLAISEEILGVTVNNYVTSSDLARTDFYQNMQYQVYMDLSPIATGFYPKIQSLEEQELTKLPVSTFRMARKSLYYMKNYDITFPEVNVYASGINEINIEFSEQNENLVMTLNEKDYPITQRVMTFYYDYNQDVTFKISDGLNTKEYKITKESLRKTLLTIGNYYYYLEEGKIKTNRSDIPGTYIHLFERYALRENGEIYDLTTGKIQENMTSSLSKTQENRPLYRGKYDNRNIQTYYHFTMIEDRLLEKQLFVKNGKLTMMAPPFNNIKDSIIVDSYNNKDYLILLGTDGVLYSLKSPIHYPSDFKNKKIKEMSSNILDQSTMIMIRYEDDSVYCFDYRTGTKILSTIKKEDLNIISYVKDYVTASYEDTFTPKYMKQYKQAQSLIEELEETSIEKVLKTKEESPEKEYIESYDTLKQIYEVYEINDYLKQTSIEVTTNELVSINDTINSNYQLMSFYKNSNPSTPASGKLNGLYIFIGLVITLVSLFLVLGTVFYKIKNKGEHSIEKEG